MTTSVISSISVMALTMTKIVSNQKNVKIEVDKIQFKTEAYTNITVLLYEVYEASHWRVL